MAEQEVKKPLTPWQAWVMRHGRIFGFTDTQLRMVHAWRDVFTACAYSTDELTAATEALARSPPAGPWDHLAAIHGAIRESRAVDYRRQSSPEHDWGECGWCGGTGRVIVPHPRGVADGEWVPIKTTRAGATYYTAAVLCSCALGRWYGEHQGDDHEKRARKMMTLETYNGINPEWRQQMLRRSRQALAVAEVTATPQKLDTWWNKLKRHVADTFGFPVRE